MVAGNLLDEVRSLRLSGADLSGKPSPTKPMSLCGVLRNPTGNDSAGLSIKSKLRLAVTKGTRIDIGAIFLDGGHERQACARQARGHS